MIIANLQTPISYVNTTLTQVGWRITYPGNKMYWCLLNDGGQCLVDGNYIMDDATVQSWGEDDSVISNALINAAPWNII